MRILYAHPARFDAAYAPRLRAEQKHVARQALDREIFVDAADGLSFGLDDHGVSGGLGDRTARCDGSEPCATPPADASVDLIAMDQGPAAPARRRDSLR